MNINHEREGEGERAAPEEISIFFLFLNDAGIPKNA